MAVCFTVALKAINDVYRIERKNIEKQWEKNIEKQWEREKTIFFSGRIGG